MVNHSYYYNIYFVFLDQLVKNDDHQYTWFSMNRESINGGQSYKFLRCFNTTLNGLPKGKKLELCGKINMLILSLSFSNDRCITAIWYMVQEYTCDSSEFRAHI
jgi:hypothetical protein